MSANLKYLSKNLILRLSSVILILLSVGIAYLSFRRGFIPRSLTLATTTSLENSGLLDVLIPEFEKKYNCKVKVIPCGSGQAIKIAKDGNADVIFVHDPESEEEFVASGYGIKRYPVMYNNFVIVGPISNPAGISPVNPASRNASSIHTQEMGSNCKTVFDAFKKITQSNSYFVSRADNSGTYKKEISIWKKINSPEVQLFRN